MCNFLLMSEDGNTASVATLLLWHLSWYTKQFIVNRVRDNMPRENGKVRTQRRKTVLVPKYPDDGLQSYMTVSLRYKVQKTVSKCTCVWIYSVHTTVSNCPRFAILHQELMLLPQPITQPAKHEARNNNNNRNIYFSVLIQQLQVRITKSVQGDEIYTKQTTKSENQTEYINRSKHFLVLSNCQTR